MWVLVLGLWELTQTHNKTITQTIGAMEPAVADPDNPVALSEHLLCLLYEAGSGDGSVVVKEEGKVTIFI